jgi:hypothetical protein
VKEDDSGGKGAERPEEPAALGSDAPGTGESSPSESKEEKQP